MDEVLKLDGVAAVNLAEPSPDDLERVVKAYSDLRAQLADREREIERLKASEQYLVKQRDEAQERYDGVHQQRMRFVEKCNVLQSRNDRLRSALEWYADANNYQREERINGRLYILSPDGSDSVAIQALATVKETLL